jgi:TRAP-type uncharacterized transport system fused permease subunit
MFVYGPSLLLRGNLSETILAFITGVIGTVILSAATQGWLLGIGDLNYLMRGCLFGASLFLLKPGWITDIIGVLILLAIFALHWRKKGWGFTRALLDVKEK